MLISSEFSRIDGEGVIVWRQSPAKRMIAVKTSTYDDKYQLNRYFLSFPFIFFKIKYSYRKRTFLEKIFFKKHQFVFDQLSVAFSIKGNLNDLFKPPLYNIYSDTKCCLGRYCFDSFKNKDDLIKYVIDYFWSTDYNGEVNYSIAEYFEENMLLGNFGRWEEKTKKNPNWMPTKKELLSLDLRTFKES